MGDNAYTCAGSRLAALKASLNAEIKSAVTASVCKEAETFNIFDDDEPATAKNARKSAENVPKSTSSSNNKSKKPSPPKMKKYNSDDSDEEEEEEELSSSEESPEVLSSDQDVEATKEVTQRHQRKTRKENKNRANFFRLKEQDASFNEDVKTMSYLDDMNQKAYEALQKDFSRADESVSEVNPVMSIKIKWEQGVVERHSITKMQRFQTIFEAIAVQKGICARNVILEFGEEEKRIRPDDSPDSLGLTIADIINGSALNEAAADAPSTSDDDGLIELKVQMVERRADKLSFRVRPDDQMAKLFCTVAEKLGKQQAQVRLQFDGEAVEPGQTARDLDMEGGEVLDCVLVS